MRAFLKKEWMEMSRTGKLFILCILFIMFGIMNPAIAKLTPWMMEMMKESIAEAGFSVGKITVNAMTSWTQYYKNAFMPLLVIVLMSSGTLTNEYQSGTLIQVVTKGLSRRKILFSKMIITYGSWMALYLLYFGVTYAYTVYLWSEDEIDHLFAGVFFYWFAGAFILGLLIMFSTVANNGGQVLMGVGGVTAVLFFLNYVPKIQKFMPFRLMDGLQLSMGSMEIKDFMPALICCGVSIIVCGMISIVLFDRRRL